MSASERAKGSDGLVYAVNRTHTDTRAHTLPYLSSQSLYPESATLRRIYRFPALAPSTGAHLTVFDRKVSIFSNTSKSKHHHRHDNHDDRCGHGDDQGVGITRFDQQIIKCAPVGGAKWDFDSCIGFTITREKKLYESSSRRTRNHYFYMVKIRQTLGIVVSGDARPLATEKCTQRICESCIFAAGL